MSNAAEIFAAMGQAVTGPKSKNLRRKFKGTVVFTISDTNEKYCLDLKSTIPSATKGEGDLADPDLSVTVSEANMIKLA
eukprot:CAMPEP_0197440704 /NCGR_PEP_ID=MMETSP1175-20131217/7136_1 /TAXON_ID=1003142 /ORGANISM="Triceratium dubium, Strain CCMP147" /LENGTH=78 /DNA_ID=CAMNT_0042970853 /DNA_START=49 /DNA_END=282 /DNA_ORIENTATION=+